MSFDRLTACLTRIDAEYKAPELAQTSKKHSFSESAERVLFVYLALAMLAEMEGFEPPRRFSTPTSRFSRPVPSTAWVHLQMYSRSNVSRKKERNLERNPDFLLISYRRDPLKTQGKLKNGFQNAIPFSRPPRYDRFGNSPCNGGAAAPR